MLTLKPTNDKAFWAAVKQAGIEDFHFHDLRHTFASQVLLRGGSLKDIQELLGHKDNEPPRGKPRGIFKGIINFIAASCGELNPVDFASRLK